MSSNRRLRSVRGNQASPSEFFESGPRQHRVDVRKLAAAGPRVQHGLAIAHEAGLLLYAQRDGVLRERARVDGVVRPTIKDEPSQRAYRLGHVAASPIRLANPEAEVRAGRALQVARRPEPH